MPTHADNRPITLDRRALLTLATLASAGFLSSARASDRSATERHALLDDRKYFLSRANPVANADQKFVEARAIEIMARPDVRAAIKQAAGTWAIVTSRSYSPEQNALFDSQVADFAYYCTLEAVNSDPNFPRIVRVLSPAGHWLGHDAPSAKWGGDNPDNAYRDIPLEHGGRYLLHGQRQASPPADVSYQLRGDTPAILGTTLSERDMDISSDGSFNISLDEAPAAGRKNHLQLTPEICALGIRDSMADWRQSPNALRIARISPPSRGPLSDEEIVQRVVYKIKTSVYFAYWAIRVVMNAPPNTIYPPLSGASYAGLPTQVSAAGHFQLAEDDAVIITTNAAGAAYRSIVLYDTWNRSLDYRDHQSHLNAGFMAPDTDGKFTFVVCARDPLVHNWLDTQGFSEFFVGNRWQGLPKEGTERPDIAARIVKFSEIASSLPRGVTIVTAEERAADLRNRQDLYDRRFIDT